MKKILIATPFYEIKGYSPYIRSLMGTVQLLNASGIPWEYAELSGDSYVERAKNRLAHEFLRSSYSHLLMIDSDLAWEPRQALQMILHDSEIIGGVFPCKNNWSHYPCRIHCTSDGTPLVNQNGTICAEYIPGGFVLYSRGAFERVIQVTNQYVDKSSGTDEIQFEFFRCGVINGERYGEDCYFFKKYTDCGGKLELYPDITFKHYGVKGWEGNYHEFLLKQPKPEVYDG